MMQEKRRALVLGDGEQAVQFYLDFGHELDVRIEGFVQDHDLTGQERKLEGLPVYDPAAAAEFSGNCGVFSVIGAQPRGGLVRDIEARGLEPLTVIHPGAVVSPHCEIGDGSCLYPLVGIAARAKLGRHVLVARNAVVGHGTRVGDFTTVSAGCMIAGNVALGEECFVGIGAVLRDGVSIGDRAIVGAGAVVTRDVPAGVIVAGNPARIMRRRRDVSVEGEDARRSLEVSGQAEV